MALNLVGTATRKRLTAGVVVAFATALAGGQAQAVPTCTGAITSIPTGSASGLALSAIAGGNCVVAQDKEYGDLIAGNLPAGTTLSFNLTTIAGQDHHQLSFNAGFASGITYNFGYDVSVTGTVPGSRIVTLDSDFSQTVGISTLTKNSVPQGLPVTGITETKNGVFVQPGSAVAINYPGGVTDLIISETLVDGGTVSSITNTVIEQTLVPEPASLLLLGTGLLGIGLVCRRNR